MEIEKSLLSLGRTEAAVIKEACERFFQVMPWPAYLVDIENDRIVYASDSMHLLCGLKAGEIVAMGQRFYELYMPEAERKMLDELRTEVRGVVRDCYGQRGELQYSVRIHLHLKAGNKYRLFNHSAVPMLWTQSGKPQVMLCLLLPSSRRTAGNASIYIHGDDKVMCYDFGSHSWLAKPLPLLSDTEKDVLRLSAQGYTANDMANLIHRSVESVKQYKKSLFRKLGVSNMSGAMTFALNYGLI